jgi:hypothetical protein
MDTHNLRWTRVNETTTETARWSLLVCSTVLAGPFRQTGSARLRSRVSSRSATGSSRSLLRLRAVVEPSANGEPRSDCNEA